MLSLENKVCIVTGGASGLGLEIVNHLLREKSKVVVLDVNESALETLRISHAEVTFLRCNVTVESEIEATLTALNAEVGKIDILINNVGILYSAPLVSFAPDGLKLHDSETWEKVLATNLTSVFLMSKHVVEAMVRRRTKGVIVNISSVSARGNAGQSAYSAAKAGIEALTKVWGKELPPLGIRCFGLAPGFCDTDSTHAVMNERVLKQVIEKVPLRRLGRAEDVASMLISGLKNEFLNGKIIEIDGGLVI